MGGDKGYHTREFVEGARGQGIVSHPALKAGQKTWRVRLTAAHALSQKLRKRIEEIFGWTKTTGCLRKSRYRGVDRQIHRYNTSSPLATRCGWPSCSSPAHRNRCRLFHRLLRGEIIRTGAEE
ncbi:MAG TPA: hypothetical protein VK178_04870 [Opitutaceae bacterium]|nr:hypothetical protein [Opitutaceae bacterium]